MCLRLWPQFYNSSQALALCVCVCFILFCLNLAFERVAGLWGAAECEVLVRLRQAPAFGLRETSVKQQNAELIENVSVFFTGPHKCERFVLILEHITHCFKDDHVTVWQTQNQKWECPSISISDSVLHKCGEIYELWCVCGRVQCSELQSRDSQSSFCLWPFENKVCSLYTSMSRIRRAKQWFFLCCLNHFQRLCEVNLSRSLQDKKEKVFHWNFWKNKSNFA